MRMYAHGIGRMPAEPHGAADTGPGPVDGPAAGTSGWFGRNGARCERTPIGPTPRPPPPWGMQNVLCRFRWETSAPKRPGRASPTMALRFAPSRYTCPPASCTRSHSPPIASSNTPWVDGYVTMIAATRPSEEASFDRRSSRSTLPSSSHATTTTRMPAITADAALVPWADDGMRQTSRSASPLTRCHPRIGSRPGGPPPYREQAGGLTLRAGVRLQGHRVVAGDRAQPSLEVADQLEVAGGLVERRERVDARQLGPRDRLHLRGRVELHRARPQRDHRAI